MQPYPGGAEAHLGAMEAARYGPMEVNLQPGRLIHGAFE
jgi:hypothetical protein